MVCDADNWETCRFDYAKQDPDEILGFVFEAKQGAVKLDNIFLTPLDEPGGPQ